MVYIHWAMCESIWSKFGETIVVTRYDDLFLADILLGKLMINSCMLAGGCRD